MTIAGFKWNSKVALFAAFQVLFFTFMWLSKTLHVLFFEKSGSVVNFGASYSAMALTGYFSFFLGHITDLWGFRRSLVIGCVLYAVGLGLRVFPDSFAVAVASGVIAGAGASLALSALRLQMLEISSGETRVHLVGIKSATNALGTALGCGLAGAVPVLISQAGGGDGMKTLLIASAVGMLVMAGLVAFAGPKRAPLQIPQTLENATAKSVEKPWANFAKLFREHRTLAMATSAIGVMTGLYVSFITPYLPLIMKENGLDLLSIGLSTASFSLIRFFIDPFIAQTIAKRPGEEFKIYVLAEIAIAVLTGLFLLSISKWAFVLLLLFRSASLGFSLIAEEAIWLQTYPKELLGLFFGLNQSAFFVGDFFGGLMSSVLYKTYGLDICIWIVLFVMAMNLALFYGLVGARRPVCVASVA